jgi:hypothetical protein
VRARTPLQVSQVGLCETQAGPNEVVISADARVAIEKISPLKGSVRGEGNFRLDEIVSPIPCTRQDPDARTAEIRNFVDTYSRRKSQMLQHILMSYLSVPVLFSLKGNGLGTLATELRLCSTMFVKFCNFQLDSELPGDLQIVQYIVKDVAQKIVNNLEGSVCRFIVDDKGALMLIAFGLIPFAHPNDSARAVKVGWRAEAAAATGLTPTTMGRRRC